MNNIIPPGEQLRLFIAIELPAPVKEELARIQKALRAPNEGCAKWVAVDGIHLTLKFLGSVPPGKVGAIEKALSDAVQSSPALTLHLEEAGAFPNLRRVQTVWVGVAGETGPLLSIQKSIDAALIPLGFVPEARAFTPHLTLARVRDYTSPAERQALGEAIGRVKIEKPLEFHVDSVSLMRSQLTRGGAIYTQLYVVPLAK